MSKVTSQMKAWSGEFGQEYTNRNPATLEECNATYKRYIGMSRIELNQEFLGHLDRSINILEVGANVGTQLMCLQEMEFTGLYGIELQHYAINVSRASTTDITLIQGSIFDIPCKDNSFDLVFTSGVLIHIHPNDIKNALREIYRCTRQYIWGYEYYSDEYEEILYHGQRNLLWKTNFAKLYLQNFSDLILIQEEKMQHLHSENVDSMFLLQKCQ
jgi:pseudaminic acid biosynthesis-associated methylase